MHCVASQALNQQDSWQTYHKKPAKYGISCILRGVFASEKMATFARNRRKSPAQLRNIPVFGRLCAETVSICTAR